MHLTQATRSPWSYLAKAAGDGRLSGCWRHTGWNAGRLVGRWRRRWWDRWWLHWGLGLNALKGVLVGRKVAGPEHKSIQMSISQLEKNNHNIFMVSKYVKKVFWLSSVTRDRIYYMHLQGNLRWWPWCGVLIPNNVHTRRKHSVRKWLNEMSNTRNILAVAETV